MKITNFTKSITALVAVFLFTQCASIVHGSKQAVDFTSQPSGARITIDGKEYGVTPQSISLERVGRLKGEAPGKKEYSVKIELDGYLPYEMKLKREVDGWFFGNLLLGGVIGMVIDAADGAMYKLNPNQVVAMLGKTTAMNYVEDGKVYVAVTLNPDPTWEKIGYLERIEVK